LGGKAGNAPRGSEGPPRCGVEVNGNGEAGGDEMQIRLAQNRQHKYKKRKQSWIGNDPEPIRDAPTGMD
jgi:hypothetical protein